MDEHPKLKLFIGKRQVFVGILFSDKAVLEDGRHIHFFEQHLDMFDWILGSNLQVLIVEI